MRTYYIYKVTNTINGKIYIGKTSRFKERKRRHERCYKKEDCRFHRAIQYYGKERFNWEIIDKTDNVKKANELEKFYINEYNSYHPDGYNMTKGGDGGSMWNARPVVCLSLDGKFVKRYDSAGEAKYDGFSDSSVLESCKDPRYTCKNHIFMFEDEFKKFGARKYKKPKNSCEKEIIQCDMDGKLIKEFQSVQQASKATGIRRTTISGVLTGTYKSAGGYIFVYKKDFPIKDISKYKHKKKGRRIAQINPKTDEAIKVFDRIADAGRELNVSYKAIHKVIDKPERTAYGFKWISQ